MVCRGSDGSEWDAAGIYNSRAFEALFTPTHRALTCPLATTRCFGDTAVHSYIGQLQTDNSIISFEYHLLERGHNPGIDPLVAPRCRVVAEQESLAILQ